MIRLLDRACIALALVACGESTAPIDATAPDAHDESVVAQDAFGPCVDPVAAQGGAKGFICGTCLTNDPIIPFCKNGKLACGQAWLVYCPCGLSGTPHPCCPTCGTIEELWCNTDAGAWQCPPGTVACSSAPPPCDGGTD